MKTKIISSLLFLIVSSFIISAQNNVLETSLKTCRDVLPREKIYLHTDHTYYQPGEIVWVKAYLTNDENDWDKNISQIIRLELIGPNGNVLEQKQIYKETNGFWGEFSIAPNWVGGLYKIRAYTSWLGNFGAEAIFEKEITVQKTALPNMLMKLELEKEGYGKGDEVAAVLEVRDLQDQAISYHSFFYSINIGGNFYARFEATTNEQGEAILTFNLPEDLETADVLLIASLQHKGVKESISEKVPVILQNIDLQFFPEGGDLIAGFSNSIAFKAIDEFGEPVDIAGEVCNANGQAVANFESYHDGMGMFELLAESNEEWTAKITQPKGIETTFLLPKIERRPLSASMFHEANKLGLSIHSKTEQICTVAVRMHDKLVYAKSVNLIADANLLFIPTADFSIGIAEVTIFDYKNRPLWERLVFVNADRKLNIEIKVDKSEYLPREKVVMDILVKDEEGKGIPGNFSLAVVDDKLHTFADDKQPNILAQLLLQSELKGDIHEPNFYFDGTEPKATKGLDLVMLTHGWRRYAWEAILSNSEEDWNDAVLFPGEQFLVAGTAYFYQAPQVSGIKVWTNDEDDFVLTDEKGKFSVKIADPSNQQVLNASYRGIKYQGRINNWNLKPGVYTYQPGSKSLGNKEVKLEFFQKENVKEVEITEELQGRVSGVEIRRDMEGATLDEVVVSGYKMSIEKKALGYSGGTLESGSNDIYAAEEYFLDTDLRQNSPNLYVHLEYARNRYNRKRYFYSPQYSKKNNSKSRSDFRKTLYWQPIVMVNEAGMSRVQFYTSDEVTTFRAILEGIGASNKVGRKETTFSVNKPVVIQTKLPKIVSFGDKIQLPVVLKNNTKKPIKGIFSVSLPGKGLELEKEKSNQLTLPSGDFVEILVPIKVLRKKGQQYIRLHFNGGLYSDDIFESMEVSPKGFPHSVSVAGNELERAFYFEIEEMLEGSLSAKFKVFPDLPSELLSGIASLLRQPNGCFEQTSSTNYPNILVLQYLEGNQVTDPAIKKKAMGFLKKGYNRLKGFEVSGGGFSLYGRAPANVNLTAYGLMQFNDLQKVWDGVDKTMLQRTEEWLVQKLTHQKFKGTANEAYLLYALSENGFTDFGEKLIIINEAVKSSEDPFFQALVCHTNLNLGNEKFASELLEILLTRFKTDYFMDNGWSPHPSRSSGKYRSIEITALTAQALMKLQGYQVELLKMIKYIGEGRYNGGRFGPTMTTVHALKALSSYSTITSKTQDGGHIALSVNGELIKERTYSAGHRGAIVFDGFEKHLVKGQNSIQVQFSQTKNPLPWLFDVDWEMTKPNNGNEPPLHLQTQLSESYAANSQIVRFSAEVKNQSNDEVYAPMLILGIPAGLSLQSWQLKDMQEQQIFDYYEIRDNYLLAYFESFPPGEIRILNFDLKADIPGTYIAPASVAYPYYSEDQKFWEGGEKVVIE